jgi:hypothetical protein
MKILSFFAVCALLGCGGKVVVDSSSGSGGGTGGVAPGSSTMSCDTGFGECFTSIGPGADMGVCDGATTMVVASCPAGIGTCTGFVTGYEVIITYYTSLGQSAAMLEAYCVSKGGTWGQ